MIESSAFAEKRPRGRPKKEDPSDPFDWLRFPPPHIRAFMKEHGSNIRLAGGDWRQLNEDHRRKMVGSVLRNLSDDGRLAANNHRARDKIRRRDELWKKWRDIIADRRFSANKVADILIAEGAAHEKEHRTLRRYIEELRTLQNPN